MARRSPASGTSRKCLSFWSRLNQNDAALASPVRPLPVFPRHAALSDVLGLPEEIQLRKQEDDGRIYFVETEPGLNYPVHQLQASSGTLRMLALMTALLGEGDITLVGVEEPENYVHPNALDAFARYVQIARERIQIL